MTTASDEVVPVAARELADTRKYVDTSFGRIAYVERGRGPVALFIHGALLSGYQWRYQLAGLSDIRRVVALDTLGMGHTQLRPGQPLGLKQQAAMFKAFLDALDISEVDLIGNDSGGGAAQVFAARNPGYIRTLTLTNCEVHAYEHNAAFVKFRDSVASGALVKSIQAAVDRPEIARRAFAAAYEHPDKLSDEAIRTYVAPLISSPERIQQLHDYVAAITNADLIEIEPALSALPAPVLVLWGTADGFFPVKWAYWLRDHLRNVTEVVELAGARVFWPEERPQLLNRKLRELWTRQR